MDENGSSSASYATLLAHVRRIAERAAAFSSPYRPDEAGPVLLDFLASSLEAEDGSVYVYEYPRWRLLAVRDSAHPRSDLPSPLPPGSVFERVLREKRPFWSGDIAQESSLNPSGWPHYRDGSWLALPVLDEFGSVYMLVALHHKTHPPFNELDFEMARLIADYATEVWRRRRVDARLSESQSLYRELIERSRTGVFVQAEGQPVLFNRRVAEILGCDYEPLMDRHLASILTFVHPDDRELVERRMRLRLGAATADDMPPDQYVVKVLDTRGRVRWVDVLLTLVRYMGQNAVMGNVIDVTDRHEAELKRMDSERRYRSLFENASDVIAILDAQGRLLDVNRRAEDVFGRKPADVIGKDVWTLCSLVGVDAAEMARLFAERWQEQRFPSTYELACRSADGRPMWLEIIPRILTNGDEGTVLVNMRDITARRASERALREQSAFNASLLDSVATLILVLDPEGRLLMFNRACQEATGYGFEEVNGRSFSEVMVPQADRARVQSIIAEVMREGQKKDVEQLWVTTDGRLRLMRGSLVRLDDDDGSPRGILGTGLDITEERASDEEQRRLREQLQHSQKMEAIGRLAGGVAHDFNNLIMAIKGNVALAQMEASPSELFGKALEEINKAADRGGGLTRQLLDFSRRRPIQPQLLRLTETLNDLHTMLERIVGEDVVVRHVVQSGLPPIMADAGQIEQILVNLVVNARDAMPHGGEVVIEAQHVFVDKRTVRLPMESGNYILLSVRDNGCGMDDAIMAHMYEPFFTTKARGKGSGLGLPIVYGAVKQNHGFIDARSTLGNGSIFLIYFPVSELVPVPPRPEKSHANVPHGNETILVVEDEPVVREVIVRSLERLSYKVVEAEGGGEALALLASRAGEIALVLTDVVMPEMDGVELGSRIKATWPEVRLLFSSGYTDDTLATHGFDHKSVHFIAKPYAFADLARLIRTILDE